MLSLLKYYQNLIKLTYNLQKTQWTKSLITLDFRVHCDLLIDWHKEAIDGVI